MPALATYHQATDLSGRGSPRASGGVRRLAGAEASPSHRQTRRAGALFAACRVTAPDGALALAPFMLPMLDTLLCLDPAIGGTLAVVHPAGEGLDLFFRGTDTAQGGGGQVTNVSAPGNPATGETQAA